MASLGHSHPRHSKDTYGQSGPRFLTASATLNVTDTEVEVANTSAITITLPPVSEAKGRFYTIRKTSADAKAITIQDQDDSVNWTDINTLDAAHDRKMLYSDGKCWYEVGSKIA